MGVTRDAERMTRLFALADQKHYAVSSTILGSDVRLIDPEGKVARGESGSGVLTINEAIRFLISQPDRQRPASQL